MGRRVKVRVIGRLQRFLLPCPKQFVFLFLFPPLPTWMGSSFPFSQVTTTALLNLFLFLQCLLAEVSVHAVATVKGLKVHLLQISSFPPTPQPCPLDFSMPTVFLSPALITSHLVTPFCNTDKQEREGERQRPSLSISE